MSRFVEKINKMQQASTAKKVFNRIKYPNIAPKENIQYAIQTKITANGYKAYRGVKYITDESGCSREEVIRWGGRAGSSDWCTCKETIERAVRYTKECETMIITEQKI